MQAVLPWRLRRGCSTWFASKSGKACVSRYESVAPKQRGDCRRRKKNAERNQWRVELRLLSPGSKIRDRIYTEEKNQGSDKRTEKDCHQCPIRSYCGPDLRHQSHIAKAHGFLFQRDFAKPSRNRNCACPNACTE